jgi:hypothetical protein
MNVKDFLVPRTSHDFYQTLTCAQQAYITFGKFMVHAKQYVLEAQS